jgi:hypothetical protein
MIATRIGSDCYALDRHSTDLGATARRRALS